MLIQLMTFLKYPVFSFVKPNAKIERKISRQKKPIVAYHIFVKFCIYEELGSSCGFIAIVQMMLINIMMIFRTINSLHFKKNKTRSFGFSKHETDWTDTSSV